MAEFWLVSVPPDKHGRSAFDNITQETANHSVTFRFSVPELKVLLGFKKVKNWTYENC